MRKKIGTIAVDSGTVILMDPCYLWPKYPGEEPVAVREIGYWYDFCQGIMYQPTLDMTDLGVPVTVTKTAGGDGLYPVYAEVLDDGVIHSVTIVFEEESQED